MKDLKEKRMDRMAPVQIKQKQYKEDYAIKYTKAQYDKIQEKYSRNLIYETLNSINETSAALRMHGISQEGNMWYVFDKYLKIDQKIEFNELIEQTKLKLENEAQKENNNFDQDLTAKEIYDKKMIEKPSFKSWCQSKGIFYEDPSEMHRHVGSDVWSDYINEVDPHGCNESRVVGVNFFPY